MIKRTLFRFCIIAYIVFALTPSLFAQAASGSTVSSTSGNKLFTEWGFSPFLSYEAGPQSTYVDNSTGKSIPSYFYTNVLEAGDWEFLFRVRYNISEMSNNSSISISALPSLGLSEDANSGWYEQGANGFLALNIPVLIEYNSGNVATYTSDADKGIVLGIGLEYVKMPIIGGATYQDGYGGVHNIPTVSNWGAAVFEFGYRHWNKRNKAKEINLKLGYFPSGAFDIELSWLKCIGY